MYDYGPDGNLIRYNQTSVPIYDVKNVKVPVALYSAKNDWLAAPDDVKYLQTNLPNLIDDFVIDDWDHLDFIWGLQAQVLYERFLHLLNKFL